MAINMRWHFAEMRVTLRLISSIGAVENLATLKAERSDVDVVQVRRGVADRVEVQDRDLPH